VSWYGLGSAQLQEATSQLVDADWRTDRNREMLRKMLELEDASITPKVVLTQRFKPHLTTLVM
jgi:hypothetical protein